MHMPHPTTTFESFILYTYTQSLSHLLIANDVNVNLCPHGISTMGYVSLRYGYLNLIIVVLKRLTMLIGLDTMYDVEPLGAT